MLGLLLATTVQIASAQEPGAMLDDAIATYLGGDPAGARDELRRVLATGPSLPPDIRNRALAYLGDILYSEEGPAAARDVFESLLLEAPDYQMDPFEHPPEVCRYFEELRGAVQPQKPPPLPRDREKWPALVLVPGGTYYFSKGQPVPGAIFGGLQVGGAAVSFATYLTISSAFNTNHAASDFQNVDRLIAVNRVAAGVGWLSYALPIVIETAAWDRRQRTLAVSLSVSPGDGPATVTLAGRF
jgi:hypothetical protein